MEHRQDGGRHVHLDALGRQGLRQPAPALHIGDDLVDPPLDGNVQRRQGGPVDDPVRIETKPLLRPLHGLGQGRVEHRCGVHRHRGVLGRQPGLKGHDARAGHPLLQLRTGGDGQPAAFGRDVAIGGQARPQGLVSRVRRRQGLQPFGQTALLHGRHKLGRGIIGRRPQAPFGLEGADRQPSRPHGAGIGQGEADQLRLSGGARGRIPGHVELDRPIRREGGHREAVRIGIAQHGAQHLDLFDAELHRRQIRRDHGRPGRYDRAALHRTRAHHRRTLRLRLGDLEGQEAQRRRQGAAGSRKSHHCRTVRRTRAAKPR